MELIKHPKGLWILAFGKMWDTFSYFGTQTILALYFIHVFHLDKTESYLLYGAYAAIAFSSPIFGGAVADKLLGSKRCLIFGFIMNIIGNLMLMSFHRYLFCLGLATSLVGMGFYKSNATHLVGALYKDSDDRKETGYTLFYLAMNLGGTLSPIIYGLVVYWIGWNFGFLFSAIGILIGGLWFLKNWHLLNVPDNANTQPSLFLYPLLIAICFLLSIPFYFPSILNIVIGVLFFCSISYLIIAIMKYHGSNRRRLFSLLIFSFFGMFYFAAGLQIGTTVTLFIQHKINQGIVNTQLPASTFSTLYSFFVLLLAPLFMTLWRKLKNAGINVRPPAKLAIGIGFATLGIFAFAFASMTNLIITGVIIGNLLLSAGEIVITPTAYTSISNLSVQGMKSTMVGCWLLFIAFGGYLSSLLANAAHTVAIKFPIHKHMYLSEFLFIAIFTLCVTLIVTTMTPRLTRIMK